MSSQGRNRRTRHEAGPADDKKPENFNTEEKTPVSEHDCPSEVNWREAKRSSAEPKGKPSLENNETSNSRGGFTGKSHRREDSHRGRNVRNRGGGRGYTDRAMPVNVPPQFPSTNRDQDGTNVAIAETKEYEPVMFMESKPNAKPMVSEQAESKTPNKHQVISNWLTFNEPPVEEVEPLGEDYLMGEDFSEIIKLSEHAGGGGYLHLKGEMSWGNVDSSYLGAHGLGALKVTDLAAALATIPLHIQLNIPEKYLPSSIISYYTSLAEEKKASYTPNQEYVTDIEINEKILQSLKLNDSESITLETEHSHEPVLSGNIKATEKFSSAFSPEPDDVDLNALTDDISTNGINESISVAVENKTIINKSSSTSKSKVGQRKKQTTKNVNPSSDSTKIKEHVPALTSAESTTKTMEGKNTKLKPICVEQQVTSKTEEFNFDIPKLQSVTISQPQPNDNKMTLNAGEEIQNEDNSLISTEQTVTDAIDDIEAPIKSEVKSVILVNKTETENLEDWLDSVLDD